MARMRFSLIACFSALDTTRCRPGPRPCEETAGRFAEPEECLPEVLTLFDDLAPPDRIVCLEALLRTCVFLILLS